MVLVNGMLNLVVLVSVGMQVFGIVKKFYVDFNDKVEKNQLLFEFDDVLVVVIEWQSVVNVVNV